MLKLKKIAITGGIASGKSTVCRFFQELGAYVVNADAIVHQLLNPDTDLGQQIVREFGPEIIVNGQISRKMLADRTFKNPEKLKRLEGLLHPGVHQKISELYKKACNESVYSSFIVEVPLLFEVGSETNYDVVIAVLSNEEQAKLRFEKAGFQKTEYDLRMKRQLKPEIKATKSHFIISNNGSLEELRNEVIKLNRIIHKQ
jgi:dephospho-CoA kinase